MCALSCGRGSTPGRRGGTKAEGRLTPHLATSLTPPYYHPGRQRLFVARFFSGFSHSFSLSHSLARLRVRAEDCSGDSPLHACGREKDGERWMREPPHRGATALRPFSCTRPRLRHGHATRQIFHRIPRRRLERPMCIHIRLHTRWAVFRTSLISVWSYRRRVCVILLLVTARTQ